MARSYKRDANGRFAGGGGGSGGGKRPAAKPVSRGTNRLTRDNAGKITSVGGNGATARGGRLKTASGKQRATQTARAIGGSRAGTIKGKVTRNPSAGAKLAGAGKKDDRAAIQRRQDRLSRGGMFLQRARGTKGQKAKTQATRQRASVIYRAQESMRNTGRLTPDIIKRGTPKMAQQAASRASTAQDRRARRVKARMDNEAFAGRMKRAMSAPVRRYINESDRSNALTSSQRISTDVRKRETSSQKRQANSERTANRAKQFYYNYGGASTFGRRQKQSTSASPNYGSKRRGRKRK